MKKLLSIILTICMAATIFVAIPVTVSAEELTDISTVSLGWAHSAVIKNDGSLELWGLNVHGQLGNGTENDSNVPIKIMDNVKHVNLGDFHTAAIKEDNSLWMWGDNGSAQLGNGTTDALLNPTKIMDNVKYVSLGWASSAAIKNDHSLWVWGNNEYGQLGNGTTEHSYIPIKIMDNVKFVSMGYSHCMAIKNDGSLWVWGNNKDGQLGNGTTEHSYIPIKIMDNVEHIDVGYSSGLMISHSAAIKDDGTLWIWGSNIYGALGTGANKSNTPTKIMENVKMVSLGGAHTTAIKTDNSLWTWGLGDYGQLCTGNDNRVYNPQKVLNDAISVCAGSNNTAYINNQGALYTCGYNGYGQLGNGKNTDSYTPIKIMDGVKMPNTANGATIPTTPSEWAEYDINQAISLGLIPEELQSDYRTPITRLDFCKLALTLYKKVTGKTGIIGISNKFNDLSGLSSDDSFTIDVISDLGIVNGYEDGTFRPYKEISRQEAAVMLMRTAKVLGLGEFIDNYANVYDDCGDVADWAMEGIKYVCNASIMNGSNSWIETNPDGYTTKANHITFSPYDNYTREQAMITYYRLYNKLTVSDNSSSTTDASGNSSTQKTDYSTAYQNYIDAIENYKKALEAATSNEGIASDLEKSRISAMKEYWIIAPKNNIPDEVYLCLYEFTSDLGELKVSSKDVDWATLKGQLEGCIDIPTSIAGSIASNDVTYSYNGVEVSFSGGLTLGKVGANIIIEWKNSGFRTLTSNPNAVLSAYKSFNDQCLDLADDIINDEYQEIAEILTSYTGVADFLTKKISGSLNSLAKKSGLGDINDFLGECYEMYDLATFFQGKENPEELVKQMQKLSTKDLLSDTTLANVAVKSAMNEVNKAKEKLIEAAYDYVYKK